jgi:hypothetical protein
MLSRSWQGMSERPPPAQGRRWAPGNRRPADGRDTPGQTERACPALPPALS